MTTTHNAPRTWLAGVTADSINEVARRAGVPQATLSKQLNEDRLKVENAMAICRTYSANPLDALVALSVITHEDAQRIIGAAALESASDDDLAREILKRLKNGDGAALNRPLSD